MEIQEFQLSARVDYTPESIDRFVNLCESAILSMTTKVHARFLLKTAVDELTQNAVEHGYGKQPGLVTVSMTHCGDVIRLEIADEGKGMKANDPKFNRVALSDDDLYARGWAFSILESLSEDIHIVPNSPQGTRITLLVPLNEA